MGDTGSLFLGFTLAAVSVGLVQGVGGRGIPPIVPVMVLSLPIVDTLWVMGRRLSRGENPFRPDKTHSHHRLINLGLHHGEAVTIIYGLMFLWGGLALICLHMPEWQLLLIFLAGNMLLYGGLWWCEKTHPSATDLASQADRLQALVLASFHANHRQIQSVYFAGIGDNVPVPDCSSLSSPRIIGFFSLAGSSFCCFALSLARWPQGDAHGPRLVFCRHFLFVFPVLVASAAADLVNTLFDSAGDCCVFMECAGTLFRATTQAVVVADQF